MFGDDPKIQHVLGMVRELIGKTVTRAFIDEETLEVCIVFDNEMMICSRELGIFIRADDPPPLPVM